MEDKERNQRKERKKERTNLEKKLFYFVKKTKRNFFPDQQKLILTLMLQK